jgi:hypothetical protein
MFSLPAPSVRSGAMDKRSGLSRTSGACSLLNTVRSSKSTFSLTGVDASEVDDAGSWSGLCVLFSLLMAMIQLLLKVT